jgi:hypothetical protein
VNWFGSGIDGVGAASKGEPVERVVVGVVASTLVVDDGVPRSWMAKPATAAPNVTPLATAAAMRVRVMRRWRLARTTSTS